MRIRVDAGRLLLARSVRRKIEIADYAFVMQPTGEVRDDRLRLSVVRVDEQPTGGTLLLTFRRE